MTTTVSSGSIGKTGRFIDAEAAREQYERWGYELNSIEVASLGRVCKWRKKREEMVRRGLPVHVLTEKHLATGLRGVPLGRSHLTSVVVTGPHCGVHFGGTPLLNSKIKDGTVEQAYAFCLVGGEPTAEQLADLNKMLHGVDVPEETRRYLEGFPRDCDAVQMMHTVAASLPTPMFDRIQADGHLSECHWLATLRDGLAMVSPMLRTAAFFINHVCGRGGWCTTEPESSHHQDLGARYAHWLQISSGSDHYDRLVELGRKDGIAHFGHGHWNAGNRGAAMAACALASARDIISGGGGALSAPLHGRAATESGLLQADDLWGHIGSFGHFSGTVPSEADYRAHLKKRHYPDAPDAPRDEPMGNGHAAFKTDDEARAILARDWCLRHSPDFPYTQLATMRMKLIPQIRDEMGASDRKPANVDLLHYAQWAPEGVFDGEGFAREQPHKHASRLSWLTADFEGWRLLGWFGECANDDGTLFRPIQLKEKHYEAVREELGDCGAFEEVYAGNQQFFEDILA